MSVISQTNRLGVFPITSNFWNFACTKQWVCVHCGNYGVKTCSDTCVGDHIHTVNKKLKQFFSYQVTIEDTISENPRQFSFLLREEFKWSCFDFTF